MAFYEQNDDPAWKQSYATIPAIPNEILIGVGVAAVIAIALGATFAYCKSSKSNKRCDFPCEPLFVKCSARVIRVREDI